MGKIGEYEYPELKVSDALKLIRVFKEKAGGVAKNLDVLAAAWGHKTARSGTFQFKLSSLRKYGLIEGRGEVKLSSLAQRILLPKNEKERDEAIKEMIFNIPLWREIYNRLGGKEPQSDFYITLQNITGVDRVTAEREAEKISKLYKDAISKIKSVEVMPTMPLPPVTKPTPYDAIELKAGEFYLRLPISKSSIEIAKKALESIEREIEKKSKEGKK